MRIMTSARFLAALSVVPMALLLSACPASQPYDPGTIAAAIREHAAHVPVEAEGSDVGRLKFSEVKYDYHEEGGKKDIMTYADVLREHDEDSQNTFELTVKVYIDGRVESFSKTLSGNRLDLQELTSMQGGVPSKLGVAITGSQ